MGIFSAKKEIGPDTVIQRNKDILFNQIDGEVVMLSVENGEYYGMDKIGSRIWELLEKTTTFRNLVTSLLFEFNVNEHQCKSETLEFLEYLLQKELIMINELH